MYLYPNRMGCYPAVSLLTCPRAHVRNACEGCTALQAHLGREGGHEGEQQRGQQVHHAGGRPQHQRTTRLVLLEQLPELGVLDRGGRGAEREEETGTTKRGVPCCCCANSSTQVYTVHQTFPDVNFVKQQCSLVQTTNLHFIMHLMSECTC